MQLLEMKWPEVAKRAPNTPVVFPIAAHEQHGHHMPLFTDSLLLGEVVRRADAALGDAAIFAPLQWLGNSDHHLDFSGTLSAPPRTYLDMLAAMLENFVAHGFRRLLLLNGHGGNIVPMQQAVFEVRQRLRTRDDLLLLSATYWSLGSEPKKHDSTIEQDRMGHACEWETSMMLRIAPHLVGDYRSAGSVDFGAAFEPAVRGWITKERTAPGHIGDPRTASAEKGETLLGLFSADVVSLIKRMLTWDGATWNG